MKTQPHTSTAFMAEWSKAKEQGEGKIRRDYHRQGCYRNFQGSVNLEEYVKGVTQAEMKEAGEKEGCEEMKNLRFEELHNHGVQTCAMQDTSGLSNKPILCSVVTVDHVLFLRHVFV